MTDFLLEIGTEEIPARFMSKMLNELKSGLEKALADQRLTFKQINTYGTDRRLALIIKDLLDKQPDLKKELKGPPEAAAYKDGKLTQAGEGFCRKNNLDPKKIELKDFNGTKYLFVNIFEKGQAAKKILPEILKQVLTGIHLPIAMRWGDQELQFIRPIHWLVALFGEEILKFEFAGIKAGNKSSGHRFINPGEVLIKSIKTYQKDLEKRSVFVDPEMRQNMILAQIKQIEKDKKLTAIISDEVLNEVTYINECPFAVLAEIDEKYLAVPQECLIVTMQKNQKYFPLVDKNGKLTKYFILISNNVNQKSLGNIIAGNLKVVTARLEDAKFFYEEDLKVKMDHWLDTLKKVTYQEKIGTIYGKVERIIKNAEWLADKLGFSAEDKEKVKRAAYLCKADLASKMVYEFPELQGVMGRYYALAAKESPEVADAMLDHWKPRYAGEDISKISKISAVVAIADKIDSIASCFSVGLVPSSSSDPYALRRAAQGIVAIIIAKELDLNIKSIIEIALSNFKHESKLIEDIYNFFNLRIKYILQDIQINYDVINVVLSSTTSDILAPIKMAKALTDLKKQKDFNLLVDSAVRVARISAKITDRNINTADLIEEKEKELYAAYEKIHQEIKKMLEKKEYTAIPEKYKSLIAPITVYFDKILINCPEPKLQRNRLAQVKALDDLFKIIGDFEKIVV